MLRWPLTDVLDDQACYEWLRQQLQPHGLQCPHGHPLPADQAPHDRHRAPVVDYRCRQCGAVFNLFTGTLFAKTRYPCTILLQILRGIAQGTPSEHLAAELHISRRHLLRRRHAIQALLEQRLPPLALERPGDGGG
jgi:transposase-like protein